MTRHTLLRNIQGVIGAWLIALFYVLSILIVLVFMPTTGFDGSADAFHDASVALPYAAEYPWLSLDILKDALLAIGLILVGVYLYASRAEKHLLPLAIAIVGAALALGSAIAGYTGLMIVIDLWQAGVAEAEAAYLSVTLIAGGLRWASMIVSACYAGAVAWQNLNNTQFPPFMAYLGLILALLALSSPFVELVINLWYPLSIIWFIWLGIVLLRRFRVAEDSSGKSIDDEK